MTIQRLLDALVDRQRIDWDEAERQSPDEASAHTIRELRVLERIRNAHQRGVDEGDRPASVPFHWGPLRVDEFLARGAHGDVYRAWDPRLERHVALKLLHGDIQSRVDDRGAITEGRLLARVRHANVVTVYGADYIDGRAGLWMEFVAGRTIRETIDTDGPVSPQTAAAIATAVCAGLSAVHAAGLIHRDIKAQNVVQDETGRIILMDLGAGQERDADDARLEGTPVYLAPEVLNGAPATIASDVYATGVLLFYLLTGRYPVDARSVDELRRHHASTDAEPDFGEIPSRLAPVIRRTLAADPCDRFASAHELQVAIDTAAQSPSRRFAPAVAVIATALAALGVATWQKLSTRSAAEHAVVSQFVGDVPIPSQPAPPTAPAADIQSASPQPASLVFQGRDWALVTAFENNTGEPILDDTVAFALERDLLNSSFVSVVPRERINDVLHLMVRPADTKIDAQIGREICLRDGSIHALITGRVETSGTGYALTSQIVNPRDGTVVRSLTEHAASQPDLLQAVRRQSLDIRTALGEMLSTIRRSEMALEKVTTPSLPALQLYSRASAFLHGDRWDNAAAEQLLRQAIADDDRFASAYILLAHTLHNQDKPADEFMPFAAKAFQLSSVTTDVERYFIAGSYYSLAASSGGTDEERLANRRSAIAAYQSLLRINPGHYWGVVNLADEYGRNQQRREATSAMVHAAQVRSSSISLRLRLAARLMEEGDGSAVQRYLRESQALLPADPAKRSPQDVYRVKLLEANVAWMTYDVAHVRRSADEVLSAASSDNDFAQTVLTQLSNMYTGLGRIDDYKRRIVPLLPPRFRDLQLAAALDAEIDLGKAGAKDALRDFLAANLPDVRRVAFNQPFALGLLRVGRLDDARTYVAPIGDDLDHALVQAFIACAAGQVDDGIQWFKVARARGFTGINPELREAWVVADGWRRLGQTQAAIAVLETALKNRWPFVVPVPYGVSYWVQDRALLADLYRESGRERDAATVDRELMKLLAEADADHPIMMRLKARWSTRP